MKLPYNLSHSFHELIHVLRNILFPRLLNDQFHTMFHWFSYSLFYEVFHALLHEPSLTMFHCSSHFLFYIWVVPGAILWAVPYIISLAVPDAIPCAVQRGSPRRLRVYHHPTECSLKWQSSMKISLEKEDSRVLFGAICIIPELQWENWWAFCKISLNNEGK